MKNILKWLVWLPASLIVELLCYLLNPVVCLFTRKEERTDRAKILGGGCNNATRLFD